MYQNPEPLHRYTRDLQLQKPVELGLITLLLLAISLADTACQVQRQNPSEAVHMRLEQEIFAPIDADRLEQLRSMHADMIIIDVRTNDEVAAGMIDGATHIDINNPNIIDELNKLNKELPYCVYCAVGIRSARASSLMKATGFRVVYDLQEGYPGWNRKYGPR